MSTDWSTVIPAAIAAVLYAVFVLVFAVSAWGAWRDARTRCQSESKQEGSAELSGPVIGWSAADGRRLDGTSFFQD